MILFAAIALLMGAWSPYLLPREVLAPAIGATLSLAVMVLRAWLVLLLTLAVVLYLPLTEPFREMTGWCFHAVLPLLSSHIGFSGRQFGELASLFPALVLGSSLVAVAFSLWRGARRVAHWLSDSALGFGPNRSLIVGGPGVIVAAAGLRKRKARLVVSAGALATLDRKELQAGLEHERGHIGHRHAYISLLGSLLFALARPLPGSRRVLDDLHFHLERDADHYAVRRTGDPLALAGAICKAARAPLTSAPALAGLNGSATSARLRLLLEHDAAQPAWWANAIALGLALALVFLLVLLAAAAPSFAQAGVVATAHGHYSPLCPR